MMDFPASPTVGQSFAPGTGTQYVWDGVAWTALNNSSPALITDTPPVNPAVGQMWWRGTNGKFYMWVDDGNSKQWVEIGNAGATPGAWETIENRIITAQTSIAFINLAPFQRLRLYGFLANTAATGLQYQTSSDNGATFDAGATDYTYEHLAITAATAVAAGASTTFAPIQTTGVVANSSMSFTMSIEMFNAAGNVPRALVHASGGVSGGVAMTLVTSYRTSFVARNALRIYVGAGTVSGNILLEGVRG